MTKYQIVVKVTGLVALEIEALDETDAIKTALGTRQDLNLEEDLNEVVLSVVDIRTV